MKEGGDKGGGTGVSMDAELSQLVRFVHQADDLLLFVERGDGNLKCLNITLRNERLCRTALGKFHMR